MTQYFNVGKIVNTHGIRGELKVISWTDFPEQRYAIGETLYIEIAPNEMLEVTIASHRLHKNFHLLTFTGYDHIQAVEPLKGKVLKVKEDQLSDLEADEFYYHEIIDCEVWTEDGEKLGVIKEILAPGANDVWVVKREGKKDVLLPYIEEVVKKVDLDQKKVTIHVMEGLL